MIILHVDAQSVKEKVFSPSQRQIDEATEREREND